MPVAGLRGQKVNAPDTVLQRVRSMSAFVACDQTATQPAREPIHRHHHQDNQHDVIGHPFPVFLRDHRLREQQTNTAAPSSDVVFDGTYLTYHFKLLNLHPSSNTTTYRVNFRDGGSSYDASKQTTFFAANHGEDGSGASVAHSDGQSLANNT